MSRVVSLVRELSVLLHGGTDIERRKVFRSDSSGMDLEGRSTRTKIIPVALLISVQYRSG